MASRHRKNRRLERADQLDALLHSQVEDLWRNLDSSCDRGAVSRFASFSGEARQCGLDVLYDIEGDLAEAAM